jgi:hypothetical protein
VWVRILAIETGVQGTGTAEFRTRGLAGPSASLQIPVTFNGIVIGTLPIPAGTTKFLGVEGSGGVDNLSVPQ